MDLFQLLGKKEDHPIYEKLATSSLLRQYDFLNSIIVAAVEAKWTKVSNELICAFNFHAIACLHTPAGQFRPRPVSIDGRRAPHHSSVPALMDDMVGSINRFWDRTEDLALASFALWNLNWIHPFINGNGRTARALCYYIIGVKNGGVPKKDSRYADLPELIRRNYPQYLAAIREAHALHRGKQDKMPFFPVYRFLQQITGHPQP